MINQKTVIINLSSNFLSRSLLRTDFIGHLHQGGFRIIALSGANRIDYYRKEFSHLPVIFINAPNTNSVIEWLFKFLEVASIHTKTQYMLAMWGLKRLSSKTPILVRYFSFIWKALFRFLGAFAFYRRTFRLIYSILPSNFYGSIFKEFKPSIVFAPTMLPEDASFLKEARKSGIKTIGMVLSWDNLYSKSSLRVHPDLLLAATLSIKEQAKNLGDYPEEKIVLTGFPQYDRYFKKNSILSREDFYKSIGADPQKKLILYAISGKAGLHVDYEMVLILKTLIDENKIAPFNVLLRPYPKFDLPIEKIEKIKNKFGFLVRPSMAHVGGGRDDWEFDESSLSFLENSLAHADIVITMYSTFFIEAAIFNKPVIGIAFDGNKKYDYWNSTVRFFDWDHLAEIKNLGGVRRVFSKADLIDAINIYEKEPSLDTLGRKKIVESQCLFADGASSKRVAESIIRLSQAKE